jgi:hypothetical protein
MSVRRYAENTTVSVDKSRGDISGILAAHGVERMAWGTGPEGDTLQFELDGHQFRFAIDFVGKAVSTRVARRQDQRRAAPGLTVADLVDPRAGEGRA